MACETAPKKLTQTLELKTEERRTMDSQKIPTIIDASYTGIIKGVILEKPAPGDPLSSWERHQTSTYTVSRLGLSCGLAFANDYTVRKMLAMAVVEGYLRASEQKFHKETRDIPSFGFDVLNQVKLALNNLSD